MKPENPGKFRSLVLWHKPEKMGHSVAVDAEPGKNRLRPQSRKVCCQNSAYFMKDGQGARMEHGFW